MIIKLLPENDEERKMFMENFGAEKSIHKNVREFFVFGNKVESGRLIDFHDWNGSNKYLMANLIYFYEIVNDRRREENGEIVPRQPILPRQVNPQLKMVNNENIEENNVLSQNRPPIIKRGTVNNQNITPIDVESIRKPRIVQMNPQDLNVIEKNLKMEFEQGDNVDNVDNVDCEDEWDSDGEENNKNIKLPVPPPQLQFENKENKENRGLRIHPENYP